MNIKWNKDFLDVLKNGVEYEIGANANETARNIEKGMKKAGITPNSSEVRKIARQHHK